MIWLKHVNHPLNYMYLVVSVIFYSFDKTLIQIFSCLVTIPLPRFYVEVSSPVQGVCYTLKRIGGQWHSPKKVDFEFSIMRSFENIFYLSKDFFQAWDGDKFICMDSYSPENCLIYSFGIRFYS